MIHEIKILSKDFNLFSSDNIVYNTDESSSGYKSGDFVILKEVDENKKYTGNEMTFWIKTSTKSSFTMERISKSEFRRIKIQRGEK